MDVKINTIGDLKAPVIVIDDFLPHARNIIEAAVALSPFPLEGGTAYPGRRRQISPGDAASAYVVEVLQAVSPLIRDAFGAPSFSVVEASFSLVTTRPEALRAVQRVPHFDCEDQHILAVLHHLHDLPDTGTAFYRHIATGMERADKETAPALREYLRTDGSHMSGTDFTGDTNECYEKLFAVEGRFNRLVIYQGCLLHSGVISPEFAYSSDPRTGRLTGNIFVRMNGAMQN